MSRRRRSENRRAVGAIFSVIIATTLLALLTLLHSEAAQSEAEAWLTVSYGDLVDQADITQTGETVSEDRRRLAAGEGTDGALQPFLEPWAGVLPHVIDMVRGPSPRPARSAVDGYVAGATRPAWVDILRGGRYVVTFDGIDLATVFAPGKTSREAYEQAATVVRHPLGALQPSAGRALRVEAYAYQNDYRSLQLRVSTAPYSFSATSFGPPSGKKNVDLQALSGFFTGDVEISGARIDPDDGLVLVGRNGVRSTLAGRPLSLSDLAVTYRAAFHAGRNTAFVSLDPSRDPTRVNVNFGGYLEDTRVGTAVLQADMRFKTVASGLDAMTYADLRSPARSLIPGFMTGSERDLATRPDPAASWQGTRFWFYPDSVEVISDNEGRTAFLNRTRFTADAERSRADFGSAGDFDAAKKNRVSPTIRANIDDINARYENYAQAFPELQELSVVARLMALCSWLQRARTGEVDLDALLAVELPAWTTPRDKPQLLTISMLAYTGNDEPSEKDVLQKTDVRRIDDLLDQPIRDVITSEKALRRLVAAVGGADAGAQAVDTGRKGRDYIRSREHLKAFSEAVAETLRDRAMSASRPSGDLNAQKARIDEMKVELDKLKEVMAEGTKQHNSNLDKYNALVRQYNGALNAYRAARDVSSVARTVMTIEGGINLSPTDFKITRESAAPALESVRTANTSSGIAAGLKRSARPSDLPAAPTTRFGWQWQARIRSEDPGSTTEGGGDSAGNSFSSVRTAAGGDWTDRVALSGGRTIERTYVAKIKELRIATYDHGGAESLLVAQRDPSGAVVFKRGDPRSLPPLK